MHRRSFLSLAAGLIATRGHAAGNPLPAVSIIHPVMPPQDVSGLVMTNSNGDPVSLSDYLGRIVVLNLWASWCAPCRLEMPSLSRLADQVDPDQVAVLALAFDKGNPVPVQQFFNSTGITNLPILLGDAQNMETVLGWGLLPTTIILNKSGQHVYTAKGDAIWDDSATQKWLDYLAT